MDTAEKRINKDLILRERLAMERTDMAIDRTLLSFIRTSMYFAVAGMTVHGLLNLKHGLLIEIAFWIASAIILTVGIIKFRSQKKKLKDSEKHIGSYLLEWEDDI